MIQDILQRLRDSLTLTDTEWDVPVGSPEYKILEAVATELYAAQTNYLLGDAHLDADAKVGIELDKFVVTYGIVRLGGRRATGTVTFERGTPAVSDIDIPYGTQVMKPSTSVSPAIMFQTTTSNTIEASGTQVEIPIEAVNAGISGNTVAGEISLFSGASVGGVTTVANEVPTSGGRDPETDDELRSRWKLTVFRNLAGTEDQFLGIALDDDSVTRAVVIGAQERFFEQLQITAGAVTSTISDAKYIYAGGSEFIGYDLGTEDEVIGVRTNDYTWTNSNPPSVSILNATLFPNSNVIELEYDYTPSASRNDPATGIVHKVDVIVSGQDSLAVTEQITFLSGAAYLFNTTGGSLLNRTNWLRRDETTAPTTGNIFVPLMNQPILTLPTTITVGATVYTQNTDYWLVRDVGTNRGSIRARDGIEWKAAGAPVNGTIVLVAYTYNNAIARVDGSINRVRLVGTDTLVHSAKKAYFRFHLSVVFGPTYTPAVETTNISTTVTAWLEGKDFRSNVQISDLIDVIKDLPSVDNIRLTKSTESGSAYGIQRRSESGTTLATYITDIYLKSDEVPVLESVVVTPRGQNTF